MSKWDIESNLTKVAHGMTQEIQLSSHIAIKRLNTLMAFIILDANQDKEILWVRFHGISTIGGYLMPNPFLYI